MVRYGRTLYFLDFHDKLGENEGLQKDCSDFFIAATTCYHWQRSSYGNRPNELCVMTDKNENHTEAKMVFITKYNT